MLIDTDYAEGYLDVLRNLFIKQALLECGDTRHTAYRTGFSAHGGAIRGSYGAGHLAAVCRFGLTNAFDVGYVGSTGAPAAAFAPGEQVVHARSVYWTECMSSDFLSLRRLLPWVPGRAMDIDYLCDVFRGKNTRGIRLDIDALRRWRTAIYATATALDGSAAYLDLRSLEDPIEGIKASIAIPGVSRGFVLVEGQYYFDGDGAVPFPAADLLERFALTDLLVLANRPKPLRGSDGRLIPEDPVPSLYLQGVPEGVREAFATKHLRYLEGLEALRNQTTCRYLILWTDTIAQPFDRNAARVKAASLRAEAHLSSLLEGCRQPVYA